MELKIKKPSSDNEQVVVQGKSVDGVESYLGIPYAKPPVGDLRFKAPVPVSLYDYDTLDATKYGNASLQGIPVFHPNGLGDGVGESEDCLYLNVWTSEKSREKKNKPVVFWLHGGGFMVWASSIKVYDGSALAKENDVVVVSFNYRLGGLGYLHTGVNKRGSESDDTHCNFGLLDWCAALRWVSNHIHHFGGDPGNVTVMGQSAGAAGVYMLLSSPPAEGLFHKIILVSRGGDDYGYDKVIPKDDKRFLEGSRKFIEFLIDRELTDDDDIHELLTKVPVEKITQGFMQFNSIPATPENGGPLCFFTQVVFGPAVDNKTLLSEYTPWAKSNVKVLLGATTHEGRFFIKPWGTFQFPDPAAIYTKENLAMITKAFTGTDDEKMLNEFYGLEGKEDNHETYFDAIDHIMTTAVFLEPSYALARKLAATTSMPAYLYMFNRICPGAQKTKELDFHCIDLPYMFGTLHQRRTQKDLILTDNQEEEGYYDETDFKLSKEIRHALFSTFAHTGVPAFTDGEDWHAASGKMDVAVMGDQVSIASYEQFKSPLFNYIYALRQKQQ